MEKIERETEPETFTMIANRAKGERKREGKEKKKRVTYGLQTNTRPYVSHLSRHYALSSSSVLFLSRRFILQMMLTKRVGMSSDESRGRDVNFAQRMRT